jgi:hypothetical protein
VKEPRTVVRQIEHGPRLGSGSAERFRGYAVLGVPFTSGDVLAMRRFPRSSIGPGYTSVWHRDPQGAWTMWVDSEPLHACPRYFGSGLERVVRAAIDVSWPDARRMTLNIERGELDWEIMLAPTLATRLLSAVGQATPDALWRRRFVLSLMAAIAGPMLQAGRLPLQGNAPNGQWFKANPKLIWAVIGSRALLHSADLGGPQPLAKAASLGAFVIPQRGIFAVGQALFEPFDESRHLAVPSREATMAARPSH